MNVLDTLIYTKNMNNAWKSSKISQLNFYAQNYIWYSRVPIFHSMKWTIPLNERNSWKKHFGGSVVPHFSSTVCLFNDAIRLEFPKRIIMLTKQKSLIVQTMNQDYCMQWFFWDIFQKVGKLHKKNQKISKCSFFICCGPVCPIESEPKSKFLLGSPFIRSSSSSSSKFCTSSLA